MVLKSSVIKLWHKAIKIGFPLCAVFITYSYFYQLNQRSVWTAICVYSLLTVFASFVSVNTQKTLLTVNSAVIFSAILLYGPGIAIWAAILEVLILAFIYRSTLMKTMNNMAIILLSIVIVEELQKIVNSFHIPWMLSDMGLLVCYWFVNTSIAATAISAYHNAPWKSIFNQMVKGNTMTYLLILLIGQFSAREFAAYGQYSLLPIVISFWMISRVFHQYYGSVKKLENKVDEVKKLNTSLITTMAFSIEARDPYTSGHSWRVAEWGKDIAVAMGLPKKQIEEVYNGGILHDIGKIGIDDAILGKPSKLTEEEYEKVKQHPVIGYNILLQAGIFPELLPAIRSHHERIDGKGYPDGLKGEEIPLMARILAVSDAFDAMVSDRPYRKGLDVKEAIRRINEGIGTQFDPDIAKVFIELISLQDVEAIKQQSTQDFIVALREVAVTDNN